MNINFKALALHHFSFLQDACSGASVLRWFLRDAPMTQADIVEKYMPRVRGEDKVECFVAYLDEKPAGYFQHYSLEHYLPEGVLSKANRMLNLLPERKVMGIDFFLIEQYQKQGHGITFLNQFIAEHLADSDAIIVDPSIRNKHAINFLKNFGFIETSYSDDPNVLVMLYPPKLREHIRVVQFEQEERYAEPAHYAGCLVLTHDNKILLQQRSSSCRTFPNCISTFGGKIEPGETAQQAMVRELKEELGATVAVDELIPLGQLSESVTNYQDLIWEYFWHEKQARITGCYEEQPCYFDSAFDVLTSQDAILDDVKYVTLLCHSKGLIP